MSRPSWQQVRALFERALQIEPERRGRFLARECGSDVELRREVEALLEADIEDEFLRTGGDEESESVQPIQLGPFEVREELGRGGMGIVYRAWQASLDREVAIKVLDRHASIDARAVERFHREARGIASLDHPHLVRVYVDGRDGEYHWFAMELLHGGDLQRELDRSRAAAAREGSAAVDPQVGPRAEAAPRSAEPRIPAPGQPGHTTFVARICRDVARALHYAHGRQIVHRDVKPANLLLDGELRVKVADFGLARNESLGTLTKTAEVAGTPFYMSPEQARVDAVRVDHRTDVYSLGVVMYELLTLSRPFDGVTEHDLRQRIREGLPQAIRKLNREVPRDLEVICLKAMARNLEDRYPSADALAEDLQRFLDHRTILARPPGRVQRSLRHVRRYRRLYVPALAGLLAAAIALWVSFEVTQRGRRRQLIETVGAALQEPQWSTLPQARLVELRRVCDVLGAEREALDSARARGAHARRAASRGIAPAADSEWSRCAARWAADDHGVSRSEPAPHGAPGAGRGNPRAADGRVRGSFPATPGDRGGAVASLVGHRGRRRRAGVGGSRGDPHRRARQRQAGSLAKARPPATTA